MTSPQKNWKNLVTMIAERPQDFDSVPLDSSRIYVANANSLLDTERVDLFDGGRVSPQSVNLEKMTGDKYVIEAVKRMLKTKNASFFPGTLLRDFGGFYLPTIPVITNGKIISERVEAPGIIYYDDRLAAARTVLGKDFAKKLENYHGPDYDGPMFDLTMALRDEATKLFEKGFKPTKIGEFNALPVICNELSIIPDLYKGEKVNLIAHCCNDFFEGQKKREEAYKLFAKRMKDKGLCEDELYIASSQLGSMGSDFDNFSGVYVYGNGKLQRLK